MNILGHLKIDPKDWTLANVVPVYKKGDRHFAGNYRPISLTSIVVKVMERIICKQLTAALEQSARLSNTQFGFRANRSMVSLLLSAIHDWSLCLELRSSVHCIFRGVRHSVKISYALAEITEIKFEIAKSSSLKRNHKLVLKSEISPQYTIFP